MKFEEKYGGADITVMDIDGEPKALKCVQTALVNQYWYYVRKNIPISYKLWKKIKAIDNDANILPDTEKEMLWRDMKLHFSFQRSL